MGHRSVVVVGSGNAALCAALAAAEAGARVRVLEAGSEEHFGGNSRYTAGAMRFAYERASDLDPLLRHCEDARLPDTDFGSYPARTFEEDLVRFNGGRPLGPLQRLLVDESYATVRWLAERGLRFEPIYSRQSFLRDGRYRFWGGLTLAVRGEGEGLVGSLRELALGAGATIDLGRRVRGLQVEGGRIAGVETEGGRVAGDAVVLASGGFEANRALREEHLGREWGDAVVRGTPLNRGDGLAMALRVGAATAGNFAGCHAVCMDVATPLFEGCSIPHVERKNYRKISYPFGVMINARGERFLDEGADFRNYTYAQYGREVLRQPGGFAWQCFDARVAPLLYEEYRTEDATRVEASSLRALVEGLAGVDRERALSTLTAYNAATDPACPFDPTVKDGCATRALSPPKSNWALPLSQPPFRAYRVTGGITFTYGGLRVDTGARVVSGEGLPVPGLFAAGEVVGGLFEEGYPGGAGLTAGAVLGRRAGIGAAS